LTGAICPGDELYRPGLWIVLKDTKLPPKKPLTEVALEHVSVIVDEFVKRLGL
jgi:hypothetical protein